MSRRVVVTGLGMVSPLGNTVGETWERALKGDSGIGDIKRFDVSKFTTRIGGEVKDFDATEYIPAKMVRKTDPFVHYGMAVCKQAIQDAALEADGNAERIGVAMGAGIGGIYAIEQNHTAYMQSGSPKKISPFFVPGSIINMISGNISIEYGFKGPNLALVTACTTGTHNIGIAMRAIQTGDADVMVAGGSEMATTPLGLGGFCSARAMSTRNDDPQRASRPWDQDRDGFVLSDGAAALVIEEYEHAKSRDAAIYAELVGFGMSADAHHITAPCTDGDGARRCMQNALRDGGLDISDIQYINAHGTSTQLGDRAESEAIKTLAGAHADKLLVSSTKSMTGHMLGAAGAAEAAFSVLAIRDQVAPPTINLDNPDPACDLDYVPHTAREIHMTAVLSNSFGFGGTNGTLAFKALA
ncbi:MAG: beta-ketoacyl-ACP synthase II [Gammaproteobacteria bacterium]|nr:beta-ketoacyl-ACP synthase II [Gammaproteobacteria bacterium]